MDESLSIHPVTLILLPFSASLCLQLIKLRKTNIQTHIHAQLNFANYLHSVCLVRSLITTEHGKCLCPKDYTYGMGINLAGSALAMPFLHCTQHLIFISYKVQHLNLSISISHLPNHFAILETNCFVFPLKLYLCNIMETVYLARALLF